MKHNINMPDYAFTIRELENRDLPEVAQILANGFPRLSNAYWQNCLRIIKSRDRSPGTPQFGYGIEADGLQGVILAFGSLHGPADSPQTIVNLSSWTVRVSHRGPPARRLYRYASSFDNFTFSSLSAVPRTLKALTQLGFRERTVGQILAVGVRKAPRSAVRIVTTRDAERAGLTPQKSEMLRYHASRGCIAFCIELPNRLAPLIFLPRRVKQTFPVAQLIYCEQIEDFRDNSLSIYLRLLAQGYPALLVDGSGPIIGLKGKYFPGRAAKYYKGPFPLYAVDHTYSEMIYIGL
jgi:hypothetical protein